MATATTNDPNALASKPLKVSKVSESSGVLSSIADIFDIGLQALKHGTTEEQKTVAYFNALLDKTESDLVIQLCL